MTSKYKITATCKKYILRILVALGTIVLFHPLLNTLFTKILSVLPIEFGEVYVDVVIMGLTLLGAVFISLQWLEKYKNALFVIWGFGVFIHLLDTFYWRAWIYTAMSFSMISYVVYSLYVVPFIFVVKCIVEKAHFVQSKETEEEKLNDAFGYTIHAQRLLDFIVKRNSVDSYAIGIHAKWGEGKTFFIELFKEELANNESNKELIVIDFKPWFSHSPLDIINDFFTVFGERLEEEGIYIQSDLEKYKEALMGVEIEEPLLNQLLKSVKGLFDNNPKSPSLLYERINHVLNVKNRKIIVVIDDLDRLTKEELFEVIKLVRNSGSLKNTFFILAYDREYLEQALESLQIGKPDRYLEKVIQKEIVLPFITPKNYESYASFYIKCNYGECYSDMWNNVYQSVFVLDNTYALIERTRERQNGEIKIKMRNDVFNMNLCNIRYVKRFLDNFFYAYIKIEDEVAFLDFLLLSLLREENKISSYNFDESMYFILQTEDVQKIERFWKERYGDNYRVSELFKKLVFYSQENSGNRSFLCDNRKETYLSAFIDKESYIPKVEFIKNIFSENISVNLIVDRLLSNDALVLDFFNKIQNLQYYNSMLEGIVDKQKKGRDLIEIFNRLEKVNGIRIDEYFLANIYLTFLLNLRDLFNLTEEYLLRAFYKETFVSLKRLKTVINCFKEKQRCTRDQLFANFITNEIELKIFLEEQFILAIRDTEVSTKVKIACFVFIIEERLDMDNEKIMNMMLDYLNKNIDDFREFCLSIPTDDPFYLGSIKDLYSVFKKLFLNVDSFMAWVNENQLQDVRQISNYIARSDEQIN